MKEDGAQHPTGAHAIGVKHLKVMTCFITRTKALSRSHLQVNAYALTWRHQDSVITMITEISREVENNNIGRLNAYSRQHVPRGLGVGKAGTRAADEGASGSYSGVVALDVLDPVCIYSIYIDSKFLLKQKRGQLILKNHSIGVDKCLRMMYQP